MWCYAKYNNACYSLSLQLRRKILSLLLMSFSIVVLSSISNVLLLKLHLLALLLKLFISARIRVHRTTGSNYPCRFLFSTVFVYVYSPMFFSTLLMFPMFITPSHFSCVEILLILSTLSIILVYCSPFFFNYCSLSTVVLNSFLRTLHPFIS